MAIPHGDMRAKGTMDVYQSLNFCIIIANPGRISVQLLKYQKVGEVADALVEIVLIKDERFSSPLANM